MALSDRPWAHWVVLLCLAGCAADDPSWSEDAFCTDPPERTTPVVGTAYVGLFLEDGMPLCRNDATVVLSRDIEDDRGDRTITLNFSSDIFALLRGEGGANLPEDASMHLFTGSGAPCNVYRPAPADYAWGRCFPTQFEVSIPSCEVVTGTFTWNDNWFPWKNNDPTAWDDWFIPILHRCGGPEADASMPVP